jgi:putative hemolysin
MRNAVSRHQQSAGGAHRDHDDLYFSAVHQPFRLLLDVPFAVGVLAGAVGGMSLAEPLAERLAQWPAIAPHAAALAFAITIVLITYLSVVLGELVPKRLALLAPERVALLIAPVMRMLAKVAAPLVWLLAKSSDAVLLLVPKRAEREPPVTDEEIAVLMEQGAAAGVFHESEQAIVSNVLRLDEQRIGAIMTPRMDIYAIDLEEGDEAVRSRISESPHTRVVICRGGLEHILGVLRLGDLLRSALQGAPLDVERHLSPALYLPETISTTQLLESFRR